MSVSYHEVVDPKANYFEIVVKLNKAGWKVLNTFQIGHGKDAVWRVNVQKETPNGGSTNYFTEYADHSNPHQAMASCWQRAQQIDRTRVDRTAKASHPTTPASSQHFLTDDQQRRLTRAADAMWLAVKTHGTGSGDRANDL